MNSNLSDLELRARLEKPARERSLIDNGWSAVSDSHASRDDPCRRNLVAAEREESSRHLETPRDTSRHLELPDRRGESVARRETTRRTKRKANRYTPRYHGRALVVGHGVRSDSIRSRDGPDGRIGGGSTIVVRVRRASHALRLLFATHRCLADGSAGRCLGDCWLLRLPRRRESHGSTVRFKRRSPQTTRKVNEGFSTRIRKSAAELPLSRERQRPLPLARKLVRAAAD